MALSSFRLCVGSLTLSKFLRNEVFETSRDMQKSEKSEKINNKFCWTQDSSFDDLKKSSVTSTVGSGCLACFDKSKAKTTVDVLIEEHWSHELRNPSVASEDFWTNTTLDMESNAGVRSQGSVSSISTSNLTVDSQESPEFVNHGLVLWNQSRKQWLGNKRSESRKRVVRKPILNENVTYESLLGSNKRFPRPIPLEEIVQFLVGVWEEEGLY